MECFVLEPQVHPNVLLQIPQEQIHLLQQQGKTYNTGLKLESEHFYYFLFRFTMLNYK